VQAKVSGYLAYEIRRAAVRARDECYDADVSAEPRSATVCQHWDAMTAFHTNRSRTSVCASFGISDHRAGRSLCSSRRSPI